jgi:hypothetical protein
MSNRRDSEEELFPVEVPALMPLDSFGDASEAGVPVTPIPFFVFDDDDEDDEDIGDDESFDDMDDDFDDDDFDDDDFEDNDDDYEDEDDDYDYDGNVDFDDFDE